MRGANLTAIASRGAFRSLGSNVFTGDALSMVSDGSFVTDPPVLVGNGDPIITIRVVDGLGNPIPEVSITIRDRWNLFTISGGTTGSNGSRAFPLLPGDYSVVLRKTSWQFAEFEIITVSEDDAVLFSGAYIAPQAPVAGKQTLTGNVERLTGAQVVNAMIYVAAKSKNSVVSRTVQSTVQEQAPVSANGYFSIPVTKNARVEVIIKDSGTIIYERTIDVTDHDDRDLADYENT